MFRIARDKKKWEVIRESEEYAPIREMLWKDYELYCQDKPIPQITFEDEMDFFETGSRVQFEEKYFMRRHQLTIYCILALLYPEKSEYLISLENVICEICCEYSWEVPAHRPSDNINRRDDIDLFAAETGLFLAEIKYILADRLDALVVGRITNEIKWRIIESFKKKICWWESLKSNWAAVCGGSVGATFLYEDVDAYSQVKSRIKQCMQNYLDGLSDDGSCSEGAAYWNYGFSYFVIYNDLLKNHTRGRYNNFKNEKIRKCAGFLNSIYLDDRNVANFSDCSQQSTYYMGTVHFLNREYGVGVPSLEAATIRSDKFSITLRSFIYYDARVVNEKNHNRIYYDLLGWYIEKKLHYSFAIKAGHNDEEHNHNDVGSFILVHDGKVVFAELGAPEYTSEYFQDKYSNFNASSLGHSVPIVEGMQQKAGREYSGIITVGKEEVAVDMTNAYPGQDKKLIRRCILKNKSFVLTDDFDEKMSITERFILLSKPELGDSCIKVDDLTINYSDTFSAKCTEVDNVEHDGKNHRMVYVLDFEPIGQTSQFELKVDFGSNMMV